MSNRNNKTFFIKIIFLIILGALLWGGFSAFKSSGKKSLQLENGQNVTFTNADDNAGEDIIIRSDKAEYASVGQAEAYLSISAGKPEETLFLQFLFPDDGSVVEKVELKKGNGWETILVSRGSVENEESGNITSALIRRKTIPDTHSSLGYISLPSANQAQYIKLTISYPPDATGEFWVEAFGILGSYGLLDPIYGVNNGLVGYWTFDGKDTPWTSSTAATTLDKSGNGNTGTLTSMSQSTSPAPGKIGQGLKFDGSNDKVVSMTNPISDYPFSFSVWAKSPSINGSYYAISYANTTVNVIYYTLGMSGNVPTAKASLSSRSSLGDENTFVGAKNIAPNTWTHLVAVFNSSTDRRIYVNGTPDGTSAVSIPFVSGNNIAVGVGNRNSPFGFWPNVIDDARFYNRVLSANEITALYNLGANSHLNVSPIKNLTSGLVGYWTFDGKDTP